MSRHFVPFDRILGSVGSFFDDSWVPLVDIGSLLLVRDVLGVVRIAVSESVEDSEDARLALEELAANLMPRLGAHGSPIQDAILFVEAELLTESIRTALCIKPNVYLADRLITGTEWWTIGSPQLGSGAARYTLFSVKGGVGRTTTAAVLARHLADNGEKVLIVDLDLESPGLSSAMLEEVARPDYGVVDWFVEDLVGQADHIINWMAGVPRWSQDLEGDVQVVPAHGRDPGEYLAKLGRVYMDSGEGWTTRLERMLSGLEEKHAPTAVLLESRSGLHDIAASAVTELGAHVFMFAIDSESTWTDYLILFEHWRRLGLAESIRENVSVVSALTPFTQTGRYLSGLRVRAWDLFRETLYDELDPGNLLADEFSFDIDDQDAPHYPLAINWVNELAAGASLVEVDLLRVTSAYESFLRSFDRLHAGKQANVEVGSGHQHEP